MTLSKKFKFNLQKLPELQMDKYHHYTTPDGKTYSSVTTMINKTKSEKDKEGLVNWQKNIVGESVAKYIMDTSSQIGTDTHTLNELYLQGITPTTQYSLLSQAHHHNLIPYLDKIDNIQGIESKLYSDTMQLAGTTDCIAEYNNTPSIIDYKTKRSIQKPSYMHNYFLQATAYSRMYKEMTNISITQIVILVSVETGGKHEFIADVNDYQQTLNERLEKYQNSLQKNN